VAAGVDDDDLYPERPSSDQLPSQRVRGAVAQLAIRGGEVYQIFGVRGHRVEPDLSASLDERLGVRARRRICPALAMNPR
jgi:hypothetical protein